MFDNEEDTDGMEAPCLCEHCGEWFDLDSGYGSEKWHPGIVICKKCHRKEEAEIENDEEIEGLEEGLQEALWTVGHNLAKLAELRGQEGRLLDGVVFPSDERTITSIVTDTKFNGAHNYLVRPMMRYDNGTVYSTPGSRLVPLNFVKKNDDGTWQEGLQTEQLLLVILDRHPKLNAVYAADTHDEFMGHIKGALDCLQRRFTERLDRGVAGQHKA